MNSQNDKENSGHIKAAYIAGFFGVLGICITGLFAVLNTMLDKGIIAFNVNGLTPSPTSYQSQNIASSPTYAVATPSEFENIQNVQIATTPTLPLTFSVVAENGWQNTNIELNAGDILLIDFLSGKWAVAKDGVYISPDLLSTTNSNDKIMYDCTPIPNNQVSIFSLIAKVGNGESFAVGKQFLSNVQSTGNLFLRINDCDKFLSDNFGSVSVTIDKP